MQERNVKRLAVLIDADNVSPAQVSEIFKTVSPLGDCPSRLWNGQLLLGQRRLECRSTGIWHCVQTAGEQRLGQERRRHRPGD